MKKLHFLITLVWVQVTLILPTIFTDCLLYPITLISLQDLSSSLPSSFWFNIQRHCINLCACVLSGVAVEVDNVSSSKWCQRFFPLLVPLLAKLTTSNTCFGTETLWESPLELLRIDIKDAPLSRLFWFSSLTDVWCHVCKVEWVVFIYNVNTGRILSWR